MARFKKGDHKVQCDLTGAIVNASDCRLMWNGLFVLKSAWKARHPQDTLYPIKEGTPPAISRPFGEPEFIEYPAPAQVQSGDGTDYTWSDGSDITWSSDQ